MIKVAIVDDQALVRGGFTVLVDAAEDMQVVGEGADGAHAIELVARHHPDVVLMDIRMPVIDGIEATRQITTNPEFAAVKILILTTFDLDEYVYGALRAGASGFLLKDTRPEELLSDPMAPPRRCLSNSRVLPNENSRSSSKSAEASPTPTSPLGCTSAPPLPKRT
jgi:DNA-binding NarL/FixJ family response regulator